MAAAGDDLLALVRLAAGGDRDAQHALVQRVQAKVRAIVHRELEQRFRASHRWVMPLFSTSDVVQDVLVDAVRGLDECEFPGEGAFVAYLATIVRHRLISAVRYYEAQRRDGRRGVAAPEDAAAGPARPSTLSAPEFAASLAERAAVVRDVLASFAERPRALLELRLVDGATFPVIAEKLGYALDETARQAFCDAQAKLVLRLRARGIRPGGTTGD